MELWQGRDILHGDPDYTRAFRNAWRIGRAHPFVLDLGQQSWLTRRELEPVFSVWMISRQRGKSFAAIFDDLMFANRTPGAICRYLGQTGDSAAAIFGPTMDQIMAICPLPKRERPAPYNDNDSFGARSQMLWDNGASLVLSGTDNDTFRRQRGPRSHRITYDEAAFYPKLREVTETLNPTLTRTGGSPLYLSTPPITPDHMFAELYETASSIGRSEHETLYQNPQLTPEEIEAVIGKAAAERNETIEKFKKSTYFRREYMAEICLDSELAVVPEFPDVREAIVVERERPPHYDLYLSVDPGLGDMTGVLFAVSDFRRAKLVIEHELLFRGANTATISKEVFAVLEAHYGATFEVIKGIRKLAKDSPRPFSFVVDDDQEQVCMDLHEYHGISASKAVKDSSEAAINLMRLAISGLEIEINPRCVNLIRQLGNAVRKAPGGDMTRSKRDGHWDLIAALKYMVRSWSRGHNPYPLNYGFDPRTQVRRDQPRPVSLGDIMLRGTSLSRKR